MKYRLDAISKNKDVQNILSILSDTASTEKVIISRVLHAIEDSKKNAEIEEISIYVNDYAGGIIDRKTLIEEIMEIVYEKKREA